MPTFETAADVKDFKKYKTGTKTALARLSASSAVKYLYFHKFKFDDKERPLLLVDFSDSLTRTLGSTISEGKCKLDDHDRITFDATKGEVDVDKVAHLFSSIGISRAVARPDEPAPGASARPEGDKLDMKYGLTEIRNWGDDAAKLVEKFDGLLGLYKGLPEIKPEAKELHQKHQAIKARMAELIKTRISNTDQERADALEKVKLLRKDVEALNLEARKPPPKPAEHQADRGRRQGPVDADEAGAGAGHGEDHDHAAGERLHQGGEARAHRRGDQVGRARHAVAGREGHPREVRRAAEAQAPAGLRRHHRRPLQGGPAARRGDLLQEVEGGREADRRRRRKARRR